MNADEKHLDVEFKRYLQILKPYLGQLSDQFIINNCNVWIQRLSEKNVDKILRNKYIYALFSNLARGYLDMPFLNGPPNVLPPIHDDVSDSESSSAECLVINPDNSTKIIFGREKPLASDTDSQEYERNKETSVNKSTSVERYDQTTVYQPNVVCYTCPDFLIDDNQASGDEYDNRAASLIKKVREIKTQNIILHNELVALRGDFAVNHNNEIATMVDNSTNPYISESQSNTTLRNLKCKLQEMKYTRNSLIDTIAKLQDQLNNFEEMKRHEIDELEARHRLQIIQIKTAVQDEVKGIYEKKIEELKQSYEVNMKNIGQSYVNDTITEQNKVIAEKDMELDRLKLQLEDQKKNFQSVLNKLIQEPNDETKDNNLKTQVQQYEKRLNKLEKSKIKCAKVYETKLASLQRDKHLTECSLHLQLVKQRAQVLSEVADENQTDLTTALNNLEIKYKDIMANVQTSATNRRVQDQIALESILQAACGFQSEISRGTNSQFSGKNFRHTNQSGDTENWSLATGNKVGNRSLYDDGLLTGQCLDGEKVQLFERHIPQRDSGH